MKYHLLYKLTYLLLIITGISLLSPETIHPQSDYKITPFKLKKKPPSKKDKDPLDDSKIINKEEEIREKEDENTKKTDEKKIDDKKDDKKDVNKIDNKKNIQKDEEFSEISVSLLGLYDMLNKKFGMEARLQLETNRILVPLEFQYFFGTYLRVRSYPLFYLSERKSREDSGVFISIFTEAVIQSSQSNLSDGELGIGGGFGGASFNVYLWLTLGYDQGSPTVQDIFSVRARIKHQPLKFFYWLLGLRVGTAIARGSVVTTSSTTFESELELGFFVYKGLHIIGGAELKTNNLGGLVDSSASISGISSSFQAIFKFGVGYKF